MMKVMSMIVTVTVTNVIIMHGADADGIFHNHVAQPQPDGEVPQPATITDDERVRWCTKLRS